MASDQTLIDIQGRGGDGNDSRLQELHGFLLDIEYTPPQSEQDATAKIDDLERLLESTPVSAFESGDALNEEQRRRLIELATYPGSPIANIINSDSSASKNRAEQHQTRERYARVFALIQQGNMLESEIAALRRHVDEFEERSTLRHQQMRDENAATYNSQIATIELSRENLDEALDNGEITSTQHSAATDQARLLTLQAEQTSEQILATTNESEATTSILIENVRTYLGHNPVQAGIGSTLGELLNALENAEESGETPEQISERLRAYIETADLEHMQEKALLGIIENVEEISDINQRLEQLRQQQLELQQEIDALHEATQTIDHDYLDSLVLRQSEIQAHIQDLSAELEVQTSFQNWVATEEGQTAIYNLQNAVEDLRNNNTPIPQDLIDVLHPKLQASMSEMTSNLNNSAETSQSIERLHEQLDNLRTGDRHELIEAQYGNVFSRNASWLVNEWTTRHIGMNTNSELRQVMENPLRTENGDLVYRDNDTNILYTGHLDENGIFQRQDIPMEGNVEFYAEMYRRAYAEENAELFANETFLSEDSDNNWSTTRRAALENEQARLAAEQAEQVHNREIEEQIETINDTFGNLNGNSETLPPPPAPDMGQDFIRAAAPVYEEASAMIDNVMSDTRDFFTNNNMLSAAWNVVAPNTASNTPAPSGNTQDQEQPENQTQPTNTTIGLTS